MLRFIPAFLSSFVLALILTPLAKYLSHRFKVLDHPGHRKIHAKPVPLMGGVAIFLSFAAASGFLGLEMRELAGLLVVGLLFVLFGLLDDAGIKVRARNKIWSHLLFSGIFILVTGISFELFKFDPVNFVLAACFITFMTNSMNMLDGMDGLVAGISFFASLFLFVLALNSNLSGLALMSLAVAGATLGFLRYNFNPASIFLGESGSTFLGYLLAVMSLKLRIFELWDVALVLNLPRLQFVSFVVPLIILGIPIFDTFFVFTNRFLHHIKMSTPGTDHSHHRIHLMGLSQRLTVLILYAVQVILGLIALAMVNSTFQQFVSLAMIVAVMAAVFWVFLLRVQVYPAQK